MLKWQHLRLNVSQLTDFVYLNDNNLPEDIQIAIFGGEIDSSEKPFVDFDEALDVLGKLGWELVSERVIDEMSFIATLKTCLNPEQHHHTLRAIAKEAAKLVIEVAEEEAIQLGTTGLG